MTDRCSIAVAQTCPVAGDVEVNVAEHLRLARVAAAEGAQVVVFPELSLTGYELERGRDLAFSEDDPRLRPLRELAAETSALVIAGAPVRLASGLHIGAFVLRPDGATRIYTKHHLGAFSASAARDGTVPPAEATVFEPGARNPLVRVAGETAAMAICADIGQPSHSQAAADAGATVYLASMFVIPSEIERESATLRGHATRHGFTVAFANFGRPTGGLAAAGRSAIWSASGECLIRLPARGAGVAVATRAGKVWSSKALLASARGEVASA